MRKLELDPSIMGSIKTAASASFADNIKMLDIGKLVPHRENFYSMTDIEILADDIEQQGLKHNFVVREIEDGFYTVISGHRRRQAIQLLINDGRQESRLVPCYINPAKSPEDELQDLIMLNATTRVISDAEMLEQYEKLKVIFEAKKAGGEKFGKVREKIAEVLNVSPAQVGKMDNVTKNATPEVKRAVADGEMSLSSADAATTKAKKSEKSDKSEKPVKAKSPKLCPHCGEEI